MTTRRRFILTGAAAVAVALVDMPDARASGYFPTGRVNSRDGTFDWLQGGGDPLRPHLRADGFRAALAIQRLNLSAETQNGLRRTLLTPPQSEFDIGLLYEGRTIGQIMISGDGWLARNPRPFTKNWTKHNTTASWWMWTNRETLERWEIIVPHICSNLVLSLDGQAIPCECVPGKDAC